MYDYIPGTLFVWVQRNLRLQIIRLNFKPSFFTKILISYTLLLHVWKSAPTVWNLNKAMIHTCLVTPLNIGPSKTTRFIIYDMKPPTFTIAYHRLNIQLCSWPLLSKQKKIRGFRKCKVHCCNFKGFKVTNLQSSASPGFEPGTPAWATYHRKTSSRGGPGFESWRSRTLKIGNFESLEVTTMYFTFSETFHLPLYG